MELLVSDSLNVRLLMCASCETAKANCMIMMITLLGKIEIESLHIKLDVTDTVIANFLIANKMARSKQIRFRYKTNDPQSRAVQYYRTITRGS